MQHCVTNADVTNAGGCRFCVNAGPKHNLSVVRIQARCMMKNHRAKCDCVGCAKHMANGVDPLPHIATSFASKLRHGMRFSTVMFVVCVLLAATFVAPSATSVAGDPAPSAVDVVKSEPVQNARIVRQRTVTVANAVEPVAGPCGPAGCGVRRSVSRVVERSSVQRVSLMQRLRNRRGSRTVSVVRGCCK